MKFVSSAHLVGGGTISGDLTINGDLTVTGGGGFSYSEVLTGDFQIVGANGTVSGTPDVDGDEFIIRNNADAGMSILAGESDGHTSSIVFGSASDLNGANISYEYNDKLMMVGTQHASGILKLRSGNGTDALTIDASQDATFAGDVTLTSASSSEPKLTLHNSNTGSSQSSWLAFEQGSTSQADDQLIGYITFSGLRENDSGQENMVSMGAYMSDITTADSAGEFRLQVNIDNTASNVFNVNGFDGGVGQGSIVFNEDSKDFDFRVESDNNANAFFIEGSTGNVGIGTATPANKLVVETTTNYDGIVVRDVNDVVRLKNAGADDGYVQLLNSNAVKAHITSNGDSYLLGGNVGIGSTTPYSIVQIKPSAAPTSITTSAQNALGLGGTGTSNGYVSIGFGYAGAGSAYRPAQITYKNTQNGGNQAGELGFWTRNTTTGSDAPTQRMVITDGGDVGIGTTDPTKMLHLQSSTSNEPTIIIENNNDDIHPPRIQFKKNVGADAEADGDFLGHIQFKGQDTGDAMHTFASIFGVAADVNAGTEDGVLRFAVAKAGTDDSVVMNMDAFSRISLSNNDSGTGNTIFGFSSGVSLASGGNYNCLFGHHAGNELKLADRNIAIGYNAMFDSYIDDTQDALTFDNVFIGYGSGSGTWTGAASKGNIGIGTNVMDAPMNTAYYNTAVGDSSLSGLTSGQYNTAIGGSSGKSLTSSNSNTLVGYETGFYNTGANTTYIGHNAGKGASGYANSNNVAIGASAMLIIRTGDENVAIGVEAMKDAQTAANNVAIGQQALQNITSGSSNVAIGKVALDAASVNPSNSVAIGYAASRYAQGNNNTSLGFGALKGAAGFSGTNNIAIGYESFDAVGAGESSNIIIGMAAGGAFDEGDNGTIDNNVVIGTDAFSGGDLSTASTAVTGNIVIGSNAMNSTGTNAQTGTIAIGHDALTALTDGAQNVAVGYQSLSGCTTGKRNTALGYQSIYSNMNVGDANTAVGFSSLYSLNPSSDDDGYNTAQGAFSGYYITTGQHNTMLGYATASTGSINLTTGSGNTFIGSLAQASAVGVSDEIILKAGTDAVSGAGTETIKIGVDSDFITNDFGENATWTHSSDKRIKKDIKDNTLGLDFINDLRTVTFKKKAPSEYPKEFDSYNETKTERKSPDRVNYGFIAQEVKASMDKSGHSKFPVWKENTDTMQELGETELITPLVKAIQELTAKVKELEAKLK